MSCLHYTSGLEQTYQPRRRRSAWSSEWFRPTVTTLCSFVEALHEGFVAYREYQQLRTSGIPHDRAIREALGIGPSRVRPDAAYALHFAGRA
jgi:hypothetical protein